MNTKEIKQLIEILETSGLESLTYKNENVEIQLKKPSVLTQPIVTHGVGTIPQEVPVEVEKQTLKAPLVGVFYSKPSPDAKAYVGVGSVVNEGDILCIIEAMKVMNEIKAKQSGVIKEVLLKDGDTVDFDQAMYVIE